MIYVAKVSYSCIYSGSCINIYGTSRILSRRCLIIFQTRDWSLSLAECVAVAYDRFISQNHNGHLLTRIPVGKTLSVVFRWVAAHCDTVLEPGVIVGDVAFVCRQQTPVKSVWLTLRDIPRSYRHRCCDTVNNESQNASTYVSGEFMKRRRPTIYICVTGDVLLRRL